MKTFALWAAVWLAAFSVLGQVASTDSDQPSARLEPGTLVEVGPHERIWTSGDPQSNRRIVQIATGMNYWDGQDWVPSEPVFELSADGFEASRLQHKIRLSADLNKIDSVTIVTPDGIALHTTPVGIGLYDAASGASAIIAVVTNCSGVLVSASRVVYENAFAGGVCADVVYSIDRGSFQQDVVVTGRLTPADYGFPNDTTRIQIFTEFYGEVPQPDRILRPLYVEEDPAVRNRKASPDLVDEVLGFGEFVLGTGRATTLANINSDSGGVSVAKQFTTTAGRTFLIETVSYNSIQDDLQSLPECSLQSASIRKVKDTKRAGYAAIPAKPSAPVRVAARQTGTRVARASLNKRRGVVVDYVATIGGTISSAKIFQGDTTYFVTNAVNCNGSATIEGGAVFKYPTNANVYVKFNSTLTCKTSSYRPAICTAADDSTVGDTLNTNIWSGYTGNVGTNYYANPALWVANFGAPTLSNLRVRYAQEAIRFEGVSSGNFGTLNHSQLVNCIRGIVLNSGTGSGSGTGTAIVNNTLIAGVQRPVSVNNASSGGNFYHCTVAGSSNLVTASAGSVSVAFYNSIFANGTNLQTGSASVSGNHNGFFSAPTFGTSQYTNTSSPFQSVGAGNYYLTAFRDLGITNGLSSSLLSELRKRTTFPPMVLTNTYTTATALSPQAQRDTDALDLGYHYESIDFAINTLTVTNTILTLTNGVALATFGNNGIWITDGSQLFSEGTPATHNHLTRYYNVQEQPTNWGGGTVGSTVTINPYNYGVAPANAQLRFTDFDGVAASGYHFYTASTSWTVSSLLLQDCSLNSASFYLDGPTNCALGITNNLFERVASFFTDAPQITFYNNLVRYGTNYTFNLGTNWTFKDNSFDNSWISDSGNAVTASYNAYINMGTNRFYPTNANDKVVTSFTYQTGTLGGYYQPTNSVLINVGSLTNAALRGLYQYATTTNQVKEASSTLDIGFHYVATDGSGNPLDYDGDGFADYFEDRNGNGSVDSGETNWQDQNDLGFKVRITWPPPNGIFP